MYLGAPGGPAALLDHRTRLEIHLLPQTELVDVVSRMHGLTRLRREVTDLRNDLRQARDLLGRTIETGAHMPSLATDLGLTLTAQDLEDHHAAP